MRLPPSSLAAVALLGLVGCATAPAPLVGPSIDVPADAAAAYQGVLLDVVVPVFDPNIPEDPDDYAEERIWPELRRTEATRFAVMLKGALQATGTFGDVRVTPDAAATGDLYVMGRIEESNGEDVEIGIEVVDIGGGRWMKRSYSHRVREYFWRSIRNEGRDPYQDVFDRAARDIADLVRERSDGELATLRTLTEIRFARVFSGDAFGEYVEERNGRFTLTALPDSGDPMLERTRAIRVSDGLFMDRMQTHYAGFVQRTDESYTRWQEHAMPEARALREAENESVWKGIIGAVLVVGGVVGAAHGYDGDDTGTTLAGIGAATAGLVLLEDSFQASAEGEVHADALSELGESLDVSVAPQVIELENATETLSGDAGEQFRQWRSFLGRIYNEEGVPEQAL